MRKWNVLKGISSRTSKTCLISQPNRTLLLKRRPRLDTPAKHVLYNYSEPYEMAMYFVVGKWSFHRIPPNNLSMVLQTYSDELGYLWALERGLTYSDPASFPLTLHPSSSGHPAWGLLRSGQEAWLISIYKWVATRLRSKTCSPNSELVHTFGFLSLSFLWA